MSKNIIQTDRQATDNNITWRMRFVFYILKAKNTHPLISNRVKPA
jgi:hypothetical protein